MYVLGFIINLPFSCEMYKEQKPITKKQTSVKDDLLVCILIKTTSPISSWQLMRAATNTTESKALLHIII